MKRLFEQKNGKFMLGMAGVLAAAGIFGASAVWATPSSGVAIDDVTSGIRVRDEAVDGDQIGSLSSGEQVTITGETTGSDGKVWYSITFERNGVEMEGWVRSDLIDTTSEVPVEDAGEETEESSDETTDENAVDADSAADDDASADEVTVPIQSGIVRFELNDGYVDLEDVPEDIAGTVSNRFVEAECELSDGTVSGYRLASPDELVSTDADLTNFYYLYGTNENGESGWYIYDLSQQSLMKSTENMSYSLADSTPTNSSSSEFELDSVVRMIIGALGLVCVLLLILAIVFSARYRRLRKILEKEIDEEEEVRTEAKHEHREKVKEPEKSDSVLDLDEMDDSDYETMLGQYLDEHMDSAEDEEQAPHEPVMPKQEDDGEPFDDADDEILSDLLDSHSEDLPEEDDDFDFFDDEEIEENLDDYEKKVDAESKKIAEEPEFYDDEDDDDLEFL